MRTLPPLHRRLSNSEKRKEGPPKQTRSFVEGVADLAVEPSRRRCSQFDKGSEDQVNTNSEVSPIRLLLDSTFTWSWLIGIEMKMQDALKSSSDLDVSRGFEQRERVRRRYSADFATLRVPISCSIPNLLSPGPANAPSLTSSIC